MATAKRSGQSLVYDDFSGEEIDENLWSYLTLPKPGGGEWTCLEPSVVTRVGEGTLDFSCQRFSPTHDSVRVFDNLKHQLVSTKRFNTDHRKVAFAFDMAATSVGETPADYRDGFASFTLVDIESGWSFQVCCNGSKVFGLYDSLRNAYRKNASIHAIDAPTPEVRTASNSRSHEVIIDSAQRLLDWWVDGQLACRAFDVDIPPRLSIALGLATLRSSERSPARGFRQEAGLSVSFGPVNIRTEPIV